MKALLTPFLSLIVAMLLFCQVAVSQEIITSVPAINTCPGTQNVEIPVTVQNLASVYSLSLSLGFNSNQVTYVSYTANPVLTAEGSMLVVNCPPPFDKVKAAYFALTPITLPNDAVLFTFTFNVSGSSELVWDLSTPGACQYSDFDAQPLPSAFINGSITAAFPDAYFTSTPQICEGNSATVTLDFFNGTAPFIFQYNDGINLTITDTSLTNQFVFEQTLTSTTTWNLLSIVDATGCSNVQVNRSTTTYVAPMANLFNVSGGGYRCENGEALTVILDGSQEGLLYELYLDGAPVNYWYYGTGDTLTFSGLTAAGVYTVNAQNDCGNRLMNGDATITVFTLPEVGFTPLNPLCYLSEPFLLTGGSPEGGVYSGEGVENGYFHSELYGPGIYTITYSYTDVNGCTNSTSQDLIVFGLPYVYFGPVPPICDNADSVILVGEPTEGTFSGPGVVNGIFYPAIAGTGVHILTYTVTSIEGCSNSMTQEVAVLPLPEVSISPISNICLNETPVTLNGNPEGGWFEGPGVTGNTFYPEVATPGTWTISYYFTNEAGCTSSAFTQVTVMPVPQVTVEAMGPYCLNAPPVTLTGTPAGGIFSGDGVQNGQFFPEAAGSGVWSIYYTFTDENGCSSSNGTNITVYSLPEVYMYGLDPVCVQGDPVTLAAWPEGGSFSGTAVVGNLFYPNIAGPGTFAITYTFTDEQGCSNTSIQEIIVNEAAQADFQLPQQVCSNADPFQLFPVPEGGWFEGEGISGDWFFPAEAGIGDIAITYHYQDNNCVVSVTHIITVLSTPVIEFLEMGPFCYDSNPVALNATPAGGTFSGPGVEGGYFNPSLAGPGFWEITYSVTNENGCSALASIMILVNELPQVSLVGPENVCLNSEPVELTGYPEGGEFLGTGMEGSFFNPASVEPGSYTITYIYTHENGCQNQASITITVNGPTQVTINPVGLVCDNADPVELMANPEGGYFSGTEVINNYFYPAMAGAGSYVITYTYTNEFGCVSTSEMAVVVNPVTQLIFEPLQDVCITADPVQLTASPAGGVFSGNGVVGDMFYPSEAGLGTTAITYTYINEFGCSSSSVQTINVNNTADVIFNPLADVCVNSGLVELIAYPEGGTFTGEGVEGNFFNPAISGTGTFTLTYNYSSNEQCQGSASQTITVLPVTEITFELIPSVCINGEPVVLAANPVGGVFSGEGVIDNVFYPENVGIGTWPITYTYTNEGGCISSVTVDIIVSPVPSPIIDPVSPVCVYSEPITLTATPEGGVFSGTGVIDNTFYPETAGVGTWTVSYSFTNEFGCSASTSINIEVLAIPQVSIDGVAPVCTNNEPVNLIGHPEGGSFSGMGVENNIFYPALAGVGEWTITYSYTDESGCAGEASIVILVNQSAAVTLEAVGPLCQSSGPVALMGSPEGGVFSGQGVHDNMFYPSEVVPGTNTLYYSWDANACGGTASIEVIVNPVPQASFTGEANLCAGTSAWLTVNITDAGEGPWTLEFGDGSSVVTSDLSYTFEVSPSETTTYSIHSITNSFGCTSVIDIAVIITVVPYPVVYPVTGGGIICHEVESTDITLGGSQEGYVYTLYINGEATTHTLSGTGSALVFTVTPVSGEYSINASSAIGCGQLMENSVNMIVNPELFANAGPDVTILEGGNTMLTGVADGGTAPYTYFWYPGTSLDDQTSATPVASPGETTTYQLMVMDEANCMAMDEVTVTVIQIQDDITGTLTYLNNVYTPLNSSTVTLVQNGVSVATTLTDENGHYSFLNLPFGTYSLMAQTNKSWGGGNAVDGLLMLKHFVGTNYLTELKLEAADVTGEGIINAHDALNTLRRFVGLLEDFSPVGDWVFENPTLTIDGYTPQLINFHGLCMGDVNGDYMPSIIKHEPSISINEKGSVGSFNGITTIPVISEQSLTLGAFSLVFNLPEGVKVTGVSIKSESDKLLFNQIGNQLRIAWCSLDPLTLQAGENLMTINIRDNNLNARASVTLDACSTIADDNAVVINNAIFTIPALSGSSSELTLNNFPNPFNQTTQISYILPEDGKVMLNLYNLMGEKVAEIVNTKQTAGSYQLPFDGSSLSQGTYIYKLELLNSSHLIQQSGMMNISK